MDDILMDTVILSNCLVDPYRAILLGGRGVWKDEFCKPCSSFFPNGPNVHGTNRPVHLGTVGKGAGALGNKGGGAFVGTNPNLFTVVPCPTAHNGRGMFSPACAWGRLGRRGLTNFPEAKRAWNVPSGRGRSARGARRYGGGGAKTKDKVWVWGLYVTVFLGVGVEDGLLMGWIMVQQWAPTK